MERRFDTILVSRERGDVHRFSILVINMVKAAGKKRENRPVRKGVLFLAEHRIDRQNLTMLYVNRVKVAG